MLKYGITDCRKKLVILTGKKNCEAFSGFQIHALICISCIYSFVISQASVSEFQYKLNEVTYLSHSS